jgi:hypothetical protein
MPTPDRSQAGVERDVPRVLGAGTPATAVVAETSAGLSAVLGTSTDYARADHAHGTPVEQVSVHSLRNAGFAAVRCDATGAAPTVGHVLMATSTSEAKWQAIPAVADLTGPVTSSGSVTAIGDGVVTPAKASSITYLLGANNTVPAGNTVANTTSETAFTSTVTIPAGVLKVGDTVQFRLFGYYSTATIAPTIVGKLKLGSTTVQTTGTVTSLVGLSANLGWWADVLLVVAAIGASGSVRAQGAMCFATSAMAAITINIPNTAAFTVDTTAAIVASATVQWGTASASNTITLDTFSGHRSKVS